jgi:hypothetical protein
LPQLQLPGGGLRRHPRLIIALTRLTHRLDGSFAQFKAD